MVMPRLHMRKLKEVLRLRFDFKLSYDKIAASVGCGSTSVGDCIQRFQASPLNWPLPEEFDDLLLEATLYPAKGSNDSDKPLPDWKYIHREKRKKHVTLQLLWMEYKAEKREGLQYTQFCYHYRQWKKTIDLPFRNEYRAGEKTLIDYAGETVPIYNPHNDEVRYAQLFVGVLGASNYTFVEATWTQQLPDWIASHNRMFAFFGGVSEILVPDNLKSGVTKACRYDPLINPTYYSMAQHYGTAVIPARARKPKDKAKAEQGVLQAERWILAALRKRKFFSLDELNKAIRGPLETLNNRPFQKLEGNRKTAFETIDKPALKPLPQKSFEVCEYYRGKININYHIEVDHHYYSVPYEYVQKGVEARYTAETVEICCNNKRIASHRRSFKRGGYTTLKEHMPPSHRAHVKWTPKRMINWVGEAGPSTAKLARVILKAKDHPQQAFNSILGMIRLGEKYGKDRLEQAAFRALGMGTDNYGSLKSILKLGLDKTPITESAADDSPIEHGNIRGPEYYS